MLLEDQDRSLWDRAQIDEGLGLVQRALRHGVAGPYALQAAIAAERPLARPGEHRLARDRRPLRRWRRRRRRRGRTEPGRGGGHGGGARAGLELMGELAAELDGYHLFHSARADLLRRLGRSDEAAAAYRRARALTANPAERAFLASANANSPPDQPAAVADPSRARRATCTRAGACAAARAGAPASPAWSGERAS